MNNEILQHWHHRFQIDYYVKFRAWVMCMNLVMKCWILPECIATLKIFFFRCSVMVLIIVVVSIHVSMDDGDEMFNSVWLWMVRGFPEWDISQSWLPLVVGGDEWRALENKDVDARFRGRGNWRAKWCLRLSDKGIASSGNNPLV